MKYFNQLTPEAQKAVASTLSLLQPVFHPDIIEVIDVALDALYEQGFLQGKLQGKLELLNRNQKM